MSHEPPDAESDAPQGGAGTVVAVGGRGEWPKNMAEMYGAGGESPSVVAIERHSAALLAELDGDRERRLKDALLRLKESLVRLHWRYEECKAAARGLPSERLGKKLPEFQLRYVDKMEAFHQHVYATLAVLAMFLNQRPKRDGEQPYPAGSISKFLAALKERDFRYRDRYLDHVAVLERSADFRSKYVDHPEQHQLHDWMTFRPEGNTYVIYFIAKSNDLFWRGGGNDPFHPDFQPPVDCGDNFYVSPDVDRTYTAMQKVAIGALRLNA
jgi:hypothetical protein